jgi:hypothetical protein
MASAMTSRCRLATCRCALPVAAGRSLPMTRCALRPGASTGLSRSIAGACSCCKSGGRSRLMPAAGCNAPGLGRNDQPDGRNKTGRNRPRLPRSTNVPPPSQRALAARSGAGRGKDASDLPLASWRASWQGWRGDSWASAPMSCSCRGNVTSLQGQCHKSAGAMSQAFTLQKVKLATPFEPVATCPIPLFWSAQFGRYAHR